MLLISNHISWLDIIVISTLAPLHFIAKREVADWPFFGWLAKLQRSLFVDRERRTAVKDVAHEIAERLKAGERMVLFAEGTSSDGNQILPFKSALIGAAALAAEEEGEGADVQTLTLAYTRFHGLPMGRVARTMSHGMATWTCSAMCGGSAPGAASMRMCGSARRCGWRMCATARSWQLLSEAQVRQNFAELIPRVWRRNNADAPEGRALRDKDQKPA